MPLEIIGAGFGRTGTASVATALGRLGYPCYHMFEVLKNPENKSHLDFWHRVANPAPGTAHDWEQVFGNYRAAVDNPACCVWRELTQAYPDAHVLLTLHPRGPEAWYESTMDTIYFTEVMWQFKLLERVLPRSRKFGDMSRKLIWQRSHRGTMQDRERAIAHYRRHVEEVKAAVPDHRLLVYSVDQGWGPLCRFLGVPQPETPFPNVNDRAAIKQTIREMTRGAYGILAAGAGVVAGLAAAGYFLL
ncbi:MAG TPA: sulfotransferase [Gammaproteobacteria bacterium]|nr:sulfotransferase [Gammaproteobacteria bacterium]